MNATEYTQNVEFYFRYKWGSVTHQSVGVVRSINRNGTDVCVDYPEQNNWTGLISEMELVPGIHPRHRYKIVTT